MEPTSIQKYMQLILMPIYASFFSVEFLQKQIYDILCLFYCRESILDCVSIKWNLETFIIVLKFLFGFPVDVTSTNFLPLFEVKFVLALV